MTKKDRIRFDMFIRVAQFIRDNAGDFAAGIVAAQSALLDGVIGKLQTLTGEQTGGMSDARFQFNSKATARENLREMLSDISETARSMVYQFPGIDLKFRMARAASDADLLGKSRAFLTDAKPLKADFIAYQLDSNFLVDLQTLIDSFEQSLNAPGTATGNHVAATADIGEEVRKGMICVRTMDGAVKNKYRGNTGKLAAWLSASHVEREPQTKPTGNQPTPK